MKKSFLYNTLIISIIATTSVAISAQEKTKQEIELENILKTLDKSDKKETNNKNTPNIENVQEVDKIKSGSEEYSIVKEKNISNTKNETNTISEEGEQTQLKLNNYKRVSVKDTESDSVPTENQEVKNDEQNDYGHIFLLNIPINTKLYTNEDLYIYPYREGVIFNDGKIVSESPLKNTLKTTFCYMKVKESGQVRRLKSSEDKFITITGNNSTNKTYSNGSENVELYETTFTIDNEHIDGIRCLTTEKNLPLTVEDLNKETDNLFKFEFPEIIDI
tara:strand:- start:47111 stop:47938 length:828 start_codon:yes stop_codon:yes gene_type:complete